MLLQLTIENLALVERLDINFGSGFNVLTGETGAGKSIVLDAINLLTGQRADSDLIRNGTDKARVDGLFLLSKPNKLIEAFGELGLEWEEDNSLLLSRELSRQGKNLCRINGRTVTLSMYKLIGEELVSIYGQNHQQMLMGRDYHLELLEGLGDNPYEDIRSEFLALYKEKKSLEKALSDLLDNQKNRLQEGDMLAFQLKEIEEAGLCVEEEENLEAEFKRYSNIEKIAKLANEGYVLLSDDSRNKSALNSVGQALKKLEDLTQLDSEVESLTEMLGNSFYQLEEVVRSLGDYVQNITFSPERMEQVQERRNLIKQLKRKYGNNIQDILVYREKIKERLEFLSDYEENLQELEGKLEIATTRLKKAAEALSASRKTLASTLTERVIEELSYLAMPQVRFEVSFRPQEEIRANGGEHIEFLLSANPGEELKPLSKVASGGEISRIMLALILSLSPQPWKTLIFDEIDAGLGGAVSAKVGEKLKLVSENHQVLCVTHSPQIAALANKHFYVKKELSGDRSFTKVEELGPKDRVGELGRMLGSNREGDSALQLASELLKQN